MPETPPPDITSEEIAYARAGEVMRMRKLGLAVSDIANQLEMPERDVAQTIQSALRRSFVEQVQELRVLTYQRYELLLSAWLPLALGVGPDGIAEPDVKAADIVCRILAAHRAIFGTDAPRQLVVREGTVDLDAALERLVRERELAAEQQARRRLTG